MSYGYGKQNPFDERDDPSISGGGYNAPPQYGGNGNNVEMSSYSKPSAGGPGGNSILNECSDIDRGIDTVDQNLGQLRNLHRAALGDTDTTSGSRVNREVDALSADTMSLYRSLVDRVRHVKSSPESQQPMNSRQVERVDRRLKTAITQYQSVEADFQREMQGQIARQFRIVRPNATEEEVSRAVDGAEGGQVFTQALMQSNRQGQASAALNNVRDRHAQILKIEKQMTELAQLFQDMNTLVVQQEVAVQQIDQQAEDVVENLDKGNTEIDTAVKTARATKRKKWWCLGICVLIIVIIVVAVLAYLGVTGQLGGGDDKTQEAVPKRDLNALESALKVVPSLPRHLSEAVESGALVRSAKFRRMLREA